MSAAVLERREVEAVQRAYSVLNVKALDQEKRTIEGIASTPSPDRMGDIVELDGMEMRLPIPFLYQHNAREPIGWVQTAKKTADGLSVKIQIAAAGIHPDIDRAWTYIKAGLVRGLSIGFKGLEHAWMDDTDGVRFIRSEVFEISAVTIPANAEANITSVKSFDIERRSASGDTPKNVVRLTPINSSGVPGKPKGKPVTIQEEITQFENKHVATKDSMAAIMTKASGRTLDETESQEYDTLEGELKQIDKHLTRLRAHEKTMIAKARPVVDIAEPTAGVAARRSEPIQVKKNDPKGIGPARMAIAMWHAKNNPYVAMELCKKHWPDNPELPLTFKAIVEAADTTTSGWASQLMPAAQQLQQEFIDMYRDATIIGRIPGLRRVPFNVAVPLRTAAGTFQWVGEAAAKPVTSETFDRVTLTFAKAAAITVITQELAKFSAPSAEILIRDSMRDTIIRFLDAHFVSTTAAVSNVSPAGILNTISAVSTTGTTAATFRTDFNNMLNNFTANKVPLGGIVILMSSTLALSLSLMVTDLGVPLFPNITSSGGSILGFPCIVSEAVGTKIIGLVPSDILLAEDPGISVAVSDQATIEMDTAPAVGEQSPPSTQSVLKSMFQNNMLAIRCEQYITWLRARTSAVEYITSAAYVP